MVGKKNLYESLGSYLKKKRVSAEKTQQEVAKLLGYSSPQFISNIERGLCSPPLKHLKKIIKFYNIPANEIIDIIMHEQKRVLEKTLLGRKSSRKSS